MLSVRFCLLSCSFYVKLHKHHPPTAFGGKCRIIIADIKNHLHEPVIHSVLALSMYLPTPEKLASRAAAYQADPDVSAFASFDQDKPIGMIVLKNRGAQSFEILSIAVSPNYRNQGIGSKLITYAVETLHCALITAETDDDAVGFYCRYGFGIMKNTREPSAIFAP